MSGADSTAHTAERTVWGAGAQVAVRGLAVVSGLYTGPLLARHLGPDGYGRFSLVLAVAGLVGVIADGGLPILVGRELPRLRDEARRGWLASLWRARWITAIVLAAVTVGVALLLPVAGEVRDGLLIVAVTLPASAAFALASGVFIARMVPGRAAAAEAVMRVAWIIGVTTVVLAGGGVVAAVGAHAVSIVAAAALALFLRGRLASTPSAGGVAWTDVARAAAPLAVLPVLGLIYGRSDLLVLAVFQSDAEVGVYGLAYRILDILLSFVGVLSGLLLPALAAAGSQAMRRWMYRVGQQWLVLLFLPVLIAISLTATTVLRLLGGSEFLGVPAPVSAGWTLVLIMVALGLMLVANANGALMIALGLERLLIRHFGASIAVNLALSLVLVPTLSHFGAAVATVVSEVFVVFYSTRVIQREMGPLRTGRSLRGLVIAGGASAVVGLAVRASYSEPVSVVGAMIIALVAMAVYGGLLFTPWFAWIVADASDAFDPQSRAWPFRLYRRLRTIAHRLAGIPFAPKEEVDPLLADVDALLDEGHHGEGESERVIEIPWVLGRYQGERRVLEIGYAYAEPRYLKALRRLDIPELHGYDQSVAEYPWMVRHHGDLRDSDLPDAHFDLIFCVSTVEHIGMDNVRYEGREEHDRTGDRRALAEMVRATKPGGRVLLTVPYGLDEDRGWYRHYGEERWRQLLSTEDAETTEVAYFRYDADRGWREAHADELAGVRYQDHDAPAAAGIACAVLTKRGQR